MDKPKEEKKEDLSNFEVWQNLLKVLIENESFIKKIKEPTPQDIEREKKILSFKDLKETDALPNEEAEILKMEQESLLKFSKDDYKDKYLRLLAEMENSRKRMQKEKEDSIRFAKEESIKEFLYPLDSFENALKFAENSSSEVKQWAVGFEMILSQFREILHDHNIIPFHSKGVLFDPYEHEAIEIVETNDHPDGMILEEFSRGYKCNGRILRPAHVKIAKNIKKEETNEQKKE